MSVPRRSSISDITVDLDEVYIYMVYSSHDSVCIETIVDIRYHCMSRLGIFLYMLRGYRCKYILINITYVLNILFIIHVLINNICIYTRMLLY